MKLVAYLFASVAFVSVAGCAIDANSNTHGTPCTGTGQGTCATGQQCYRGFCVGSAMDVGMVDGGNDAHVPPEVSIDGGMDAGSDTGVDAPFDAGVDAGDVGIDTSPDADDHCDGGGTACTTGQLGECAAGRISCGAMQCVRLHDPTPEACDHDDDDCDGVIDEEADTECYPAGMGCTRGADGRWTCVGECHTGISTCSPAGPSSCTGANTGTNEGCTAAGMTAVDEDCDGRVDEDPLCTCTMGMMRQCFEGPPTLAGIGRCTRGMQTCDSSGHWGACMGSGSPFPESCANPGSDDDCNGMVDDVPGIGSACTAMSAMGSCADGMTECSSGSEVCTGPMAVTETCDFHDDDCDGSTDEGFDVMTDSLNCGTCGHACGMGSSCCNGTCVDLASDEMTCGSCTMACGTGETCCSSACHDTQTDEMNCGGCGVVCGAGRQCCGGTCIDPLNDEPNCGGCPGEGGMACPATGTNTCCGGVCRTSTAPECTGCPVDCTTQTPPTSCCNNSCVDRMTDEANCGTCGHACGSGEVCCGGNCFPNGPAHCGGACGVCAGANPLCCGNTCVPSDTRHCTTCGMSCGTGQTCCGTGCADLQTSAAHCGSCTNACSGTTPACSNGHCCATGQTYCGTTCVDLQTSGGNCGSCGHSCAIGYACCHGGCRLLSLGC